MKTAPTAQPPHRRSAAHNKNRPTNRKTRRRRHTPQHLQSRTTPKAQSANNPLRPAPLLFLFQRYGDHRDLHSFPTRRSSDLYMKTLVEYWRDRFDWRAQEAKLNAFAQFTIPLEGIDVHFIHEQGKGPKPIPLLLSHGWPGSVFEFHKIIPMLTDPARFGGDPADAFTVVAPSLPGYVFSFRPGQQRFGVER